MHNQQSLTDPYHVKNNPHGYLNMLIAENSLTRDLLKDKFEKVAKQNKFPNEAWKYTDYQGMPCFRNSYAKYMKKHWFGRDVNPDNICF